MREKNYKEKNPCVLYGNLKPNFIISYAMNSSNIHSSFFQTFMTFQIQENLLSITSTLRWEESYLKKFNAKVHFVHFCCCCVFFLILLGYIFVNDCLFPFHIRL